MKWALIIAVAAAAYFGYKYMQLKDASDESK